MRVLFLSCKTGSSDSVFSIKYRNKKYSRACLYAVQFSSRLEFLKRAYAFVIVLHTNSDFDVLLAGY